MTKQTKPNNEREKEFDKLFSRIRYMSDSKPRLYFKQGVVPLDVKDFISKTHQQQREEIIDKIGIKVTKLVDIDGYVSAEELGSYLDNLKEKQNDR